jgi:hypothetical protein
VDGILKKAGAVFGDKTTPHVIDKIRFQCGWVGSGLGLKMWADDVEVKGTSPMWSDNFDDGDISDWTLNIGTGNSGGLSTAQSLSTPYSLWSKKVAGNRNPARATSKVIDIDYSSDYKLDVNFYLPAGAVQKWTVVADDGRVYAIVTATTLYVYGSDRSATTAVSAGVWNLLTVKYKPAAGCFDAYLNGVLFGSGLLFYDVATKQLGLGTDLQSGSKYVGEVYFDNVAYYGSIPNPKLVFSDNFEDGLLSPWTSAVGSNSVVTVSATKAHSLPYSLYAKYGGYSVARATSPSIACDFSKKYSISLYYFGVMEKMVVVLDDGRIELQDMAGKLYAITSSSSVLICSLPLGVWVHIEVAADPSTSTYQVSVDGVNMGSFAFKASSTNDTITVGSKAKPGRRDSGEAYWDDFVVNGFPM